jgi:hypothetical protein
MSEWHASELPPGGDPYMEWARGPGRPYIDAFDGPECLIAVLFRLKKGCSPEAFRQRAAAIEREAGDRRTCCCMPTAPRPAGGAGEGRHVSVLVTEAFLARLTGSADFRDYVEDYVIGQRAEAAAGDHPPHGHEDGHEHDHEHAIEAPEVDHAEPMDDTVVMGVIDDAIGFAHERFRLKSGKTRVEYAWVQDAMPPVGSRRTVPCGRESTKQDIDKLLGDCEHGGIVDEDELYRKAGLIDFGRPDPKPGAWRVAHGTHVMDLACGEKPEKGESKRPIVCVQLPAAVTANTSGAWLAPFVVSAIEYILDRADRIAAGRGRLPVVINLSYGFQAGPHDGTHPIEKAIDEIVERRRQESPDAPVAIVMPAGNSHLARCHAEVSYKEKGEDVILDWRIPPDDRTSTFLEIWLPPGTEQSRLSVSLAPPGQDFGPPLAEGAAGSDQALVWKPNGDVLCKLAYELVPTSGRGRLLVAVLPTEFHDAPTELAPHGLWRVKLTNMGLKPKEKVNLWIQRDDTPHGYPTRGRQSFFEGARTCFNGKCTEVPCERFDARGRLLTTDNASFFIRRAGSISAIATGSQPVVVGGFVRKNETKKDPLARYSAGGPVTPPASGKGLHRHGPDAVAVCDDSEVHYGVLAAGSRSGSVVAMNGTSVAAPRVARWIAEQFAASAAGGAGKAMTPATPKGAVHGRAIGKPPAPQPLPEGVALPAFVREGAGLLNLPPIVPLDRYEP